MLTHVLMKELAPILIHVQKIFKCKFSFKMLLPLCLAIFEKELLTYLWLSNFHNSTSRETTLTVMEVVKNKNKNENTEYHDILKIQAYSKRGIPIQLFTHTFLSATVFPQKIQFLSSLLSLGEIPPWWASRGKFLIFMSPDCRKMHFHHFFQWQKHHWNIGNQHECFPWTSWFGNESTQKLYDANDAGGMEIACICCHNLSIRVC